MYKKTKYPKGMTFYPKFVMEDVLVIFVFMAIFFTVVFFFPEMIFYGDAETPADPFDTPEHIKPEWYFMASYQFLKLVPSEFGALVIQTVGVLAFVLLPFIDRSQENNILKRPIFLLVILSCIFCFVGLTVWGFMS